MKASWVVTPGDGDKVGLCERCGGTLQVKLPMALPPLAKIMTAFVELHAGCKSGAEKVKR